MRARAHKLIKFISSTRSSLREHFQQIHLQEPLHPFWQTEESQTWVQFLRPTTARLGKRKERISNHLMCSNILEIIKL